MGNNTTLTFCFRWPVKQVSDREIQCQVPLAEDGHYPLNVRWVESAKLSEKEVIDAEQAVLRAAAIIH